jgi:hypothetical protein
MTVPTALPRSAAGEQPDQQAGHQQHGQPRREAGQQQRRAQDRRFQQDDVAAVEAVAERREQQQAERVAELGQGRNPADLARAGMQVAGQHAQGGLAVVERGDRQAGAACKQEGQRRREMGLGRFHGGGGGVHGSG